MRITLKSLQETITEQQFIITNLQTEVRVLREQNEFYRTQSNSGVVAAMNCTLQRLAECAGGIVQSALQANKRY